MEKSEKYFIYGVLGLLTLNALSDIYKKFKNYRASKKESQKYEPMFEAPKSKRKKSATFSKRNNIYKIVLTGGPCAGKTTALTTIATRLRERGIRVYLVPEAATLISNGGVFINTSQMDNEEQVKLETILCQYIMDQEDHFSELAASSSDSTAVIICDRGVMDTKAYCSPEAWNAVLDENSWNVFDLRDKRYDGVIHLITAADGAEKYYTLANNSARYETPEMARALDKRLRDAWTGHPNLKIIGNTEIFEEKINGAFRFVLTILGMNNTIARKYNKFLLKTEKNHHQPDFPEDFKVEKCEVEDTYVNSPDEYTQIYLRKRTQNGVSYYQQIFVTYVKTNDGNGRSIDPVETKKQLTPREYLALYNSRDKNRKTLKKTRFSFLTEGVYLFIDSFDNAKEPFSLIYLDADIPIKDLKLPEFLKVDRDITHEKNYSSFMVSLSKT